MRTIHAILAIKQRLYRDLLGSLLSKESSVRIVAQADNELEVAAVLRTLLDDGEFPVDDPVIVITSIDDPSEIPASTSRLLTEFPEVTVVGICWASANVRSFQLRIAAHEIPCSMTGLVDAIREYVRLPLPW